MLGAKTSGVSFFLISEVVSGLQDPEANQRVGCMAGQGTWSSTTFKPLNLVNASGVPSVGGHLHPLNKVRNPVIAQLWLNLAHLISPQRISKTSCLRRASVFQIEPPSDCRQIMVLETCAQVKTEMRTVLMQMGFEEMPTNQPHSSSCSATFID